MTRSSRSPKLGILLGALACVVVVLIALGVSRRGGPANGTKLGTVARADLVQRVTIAGKVVPFRQTFVAPPYNGYVQKLFVTVGQKVALNAPIVSLTQSLRGATEDVFPLRSPFAGTVTQVNKSEGEYVETGSKENFIARIDDLDHLFISGEIPEIDIVKAKVGQTAVIRVAPIPERTYSGKIREISLSSRAKNEYSRTGDRVDFPVRIEITDQDDKIRPGMSASADIIAEKREKVLTLAHEYIEKTPDGLFVTLEDGERRKIEVGMQNEETCEIKSGLKEGDKVRQIDFFAEPTG
jgi:multidrug efflux pump subunit AcrA (membrane-fusion protein)